MQTKKKVVGIIQARLGSKRFPGKMLAQLGDYRLIDWVILRAKESKKITQLVLATSQEKKDDFLVEHVSKHQISIYRGSEDNVLLRFIEAGTKFNADSIVRICADNPFIDPNLLDTLVDYYTINKVDLAFNHRPMFGNLIADGFGAEILSKTILSDLAKEFKDRHSAEHVTAAIYKNNNKFKIGYPLTEKSVECPSLSFDVNTEKDLDSMRDYVRLGVGIHTKASEIIEIHKANYGSYENSQ